MRAGEAMRVGRITDRQARGISAVVCAVAFVLIGVMIDVAHDNELRMRREERRLVLQREEEEKLAEIARVEAERLAEEARIAAEKAAEEARLAEMARLEALKTRKLVALTFDDGPSYLTTGRLLDILKEKKVQATFYVVGSMVQKTPDLVKREAQEGHEIGSHTMWHTYLTSIAPANVAGEVSGVGTMVKEFAGREIATMRPPGGMYNETVQGRVGLPMILWSVDTEDWKYRDTANVRRRAVSAAFDGAIILMHDLYDTTVDAVPGIIDDLRAQGYEFVTVSQMAQARGRKLENGEVYGAFRAGD